MTTSYDLLGIAQRVAPNGDVQGALSKLLREMQAAGEPDESIVLALADSISDGLRHGNWPGCTKVSDVQPVNAQDEADLVEAVNELRGQLMKPTFVFGMAYAKLGGRIGTRDPALQERLEKGAHTTVVKAARQYDAIVRRYLQS